MQAVTYICTICSVASKYIISNHQCTQTQSQVKVLKRLFTSLISNSAVISIGLGVRLTLSFAYQLYQSTIINFRVYLHTSQYCLASPYHLSTFSMLTCPLYAIFPVNMVYIFQA